MKAFIKFAPETKAELIYRDSNDDYICEVDCRLFFLGGNFKFLLKAYDLAVTHFQQITDQRELFEALSTSELVSRFYEVHFEDQKVSILLRNSIFHHQGPLDGMKIYLKVSDSKRDLTIPLPLEKLKALGQFWPLLNGSLSEEQIKSSIASTLPEEEREWLNSLFDKLKERLFITENSGWVNYFSPSDSLPQVTFLGHSSILFQSSEAAVLIDPILLFTHGLDRRALDLTNLQLSAICCTHSHWDHCNLQTLMLFDKRVPIFIPKVEQPSAFNPPMRSVLERLGFQEIREVECWESVKVGDIEIIATPFFGEQDEPDAKIDHYTYVLKTERLTLFGGVDCFKDSFGQMSEVLQIVNRDHKPDIAFLPISEMVYSYSGGGVNGFCRYLDGELLEKSFQYTAGPEEAAKWALQLNTRFIVPYATFSLSRWSAQSNMRRFEKSLSGLGLNRSFYPLRPLDRIEYNDLTSSSLITKRQAMVTWYQFRNSLDSVDKRLRKLKRAILKKRRR